MKNFIFHSYNLKSNCQHFYNFSNHFINFIVFPSQMSSTSIITSVIIYIAEAEHPLYRAIVNTQHLPSLRIKLLWSDNQEPVPKFHDILRLLSNAFPFLLEFLFLLTIALLRQLMTALPQENHNQNHIILPPLYHCMPHL